MNKVAGYRVMVGMKQKEMATILNISRQAYSEKERGNIPFKDSEKEIMKEKFKLVNPNVTIDEIFFNH
ncbi:helix-turn-helix transcriptional regulator [Enterococcus sp. HY326]|uniref:helix-turn-helix transcriptional regulator n=1 Tax=Enterococcus sp. HY326 TaxID=2971265 RepID=UPI00223F8D4F|nr:transcriptional regulator [Enterococcus sp. HY326]